MKILYVEDERHDGELMRRWLRKHAPQFVLEVVTTQHDALAKISGPEAPPYEVVLTHLRLPDGDGLSLLTAIRARGLPLAVVVITAMGDEGTVVAALKAGADDYLAKSDDYLKRLPFTLERALSHYRAQAARAARPLRVLYAENHSTDIDLTRRFLSQHAPHIQLDVLTTGPAALQRLSQPDQANLYDVILLDYHLTGLNALELLKELRQELGLDTPVMLVTGHGNEEVARQAFQLGAASYLIKHPGYLNQLPGELESAYYRAALLREQTLLDESESRFRLMADAAREMIWVTDIKEQITFVNQPWLDFSGLAAEQLTIDSWAENIHPNDLLASLAAYEAAFHARQGFTIECRLSRADGEYRWVSNRGVPLYSPDGQFTGYVSTCVDITEQKAAEAALRESEAKNRAMLEAIPDLMFLLSKDGVYLDCHAQDPRALLVMPAQFLGKNMREVLPPELARGLAQCFEEVTQTGQPSLLEYTLPLAGEERHFEARIVNCDHDKFLSVVRDITESRRAEAALRESEERHRQMFEQNRAVQLLVDPQSGAIVSANPAAAEFYGYSLEELRRMTITAINTLPQEQVIREMQRALTEQSRYFHFRHRLASGEVRDVEVHSSPLVVGGRKLLYSIIHDITERRQIEERLRRFFDLPLVGMAVTLPDRRFQMVNQKLCDMLGYAALELIGMSWVELTHPEDVAENTRLLEQVLRGETEGYTLDKRFIHREGNIVYASISACCVRRDDGTVDHLVLIVEDITERKRAAIELVESELRLREAQAIAHLGSFYWDVAVNTVVWSNELCRIYGLEPGESSVTYETYLEQVHPDYKEQIRRAVEHSLASQEPFEHEYRIIRPTGEPRWVFAHVRPVIDANGTLIALQGVCQDITEREQAEQALRESEERFRSAFDQATIGMTLTALNGRFLQVNHSLCAMLGYSGPELLATDFQSLTHPDDLEANLVLLRRVLAGEEQTFQLEKRYFHKDGHTVWVMLSVSLLRDDHGQPLYFISQIQDITERKQAEDALRESEARFRNMADHAPVMIWMTEADGTCSYFSQSWCEFTGQTLETGLGFGWVSALHPDDRELSEKTFRAANEQREPFRLEYRVRRADGEYRWAIDSATPRFDAQGEFFGYIGSVVDITERKLAEEALRESEEKFRQLAEHIGAAFFITEGFNGALPGRLIYVSPGYEKIWGRSRESLYRDTRAWFEAVHPEDSERVQAALRNVEQKRFDEEFRIVRPDGEVRWVHDRIFPIRNEAGEIYRVAGIVEDITERKLIDEVMHESEERLRLALEAGRMGVWDLDRRTDTLKWSKEHYTILGLAPFSVEPNYHIWAERVHPDDLAVAQGGVDIAIEDKSEYRCEYRIIRPDGAVRWVEGRAKPVYDDNGQCARMSGLIVDITERKRAEAQLRTQDAISRVLADSSSVAAAAPLLIQAICGGLDWALGEFWRVDRETGRLTCLEIWHEPVSDLAEFAAASRSFTFPPGGGLPGKVWESGEPHWVPGTTRDSNFPRAELARQTGLSSALGFPIRFGETTLGVMVFFSRERRELDEDLLRMMANIGSQIGEFIERDWVEQSLRASEDRYRSVVEGQTELICRYLPDTVLTFANEAYCRYFGKTREELVGTSFLDLIPEPARATVRHMVESLTQRPRTETYEHEVLRPDGSIGWQQWVDHAIFDADGKVVELQAVGRDITERKQAEEARLESEKRYHTLFEKANDAIFIETENDEILEVNQRACDLLGYTRAELLAMRVPQLQAPEARGRVGTVVSSELEKYQDTTFEALNLHRSGRRIPVEITNTVIEDNERRVMLSIVRDISERKQLELKRQEQINSIAESETQQYNFARIMGSSSTIQETLKAAQKVAAGDVSPVLITGETGTGKGLLARAVHYASRRAPFAFVLIDCTSIPETLFESELFGHEQGAFTDAKKSRRGRLELAKGGTLFLDEISEIPLTLQAKLLQVIQEGTFQRLGGREEISLNARIITATNRDLRSEVAAGRFRADLYQRLFVVQLDLPPLREREADILLLAEHFIGIYNKKHGKEVSGLTAQAADLLRRYGWPGNVRELEHAIERAVFFEEGDEITPRHLRVGFNGVPALPHGPVVAPFQAPAAPPQVQAPAANGTLDQMNSSMIKQTVEQCGGNIAKAARKLGISRSRIYRVMRES